MKRVIKVSQAWIAALFLGLVLTGCGGDSSTSSGGTVGGGAGTGGGSGGSGEGSQPPGGGGQEVVDRSASLSWNAPFTRENGESLTMGELDSYVIRYGQNPDELSETVRISSASTMEYTVNNLGDGTWYFTIQVEDVDGLMSAPSARVSKTI